MLAALTLTQAAQASVHRHGNIAGTPFRTAPHPLPQGYLGIDVRSVYDDEVSLFHLRDARGAVILRVDHDGPAGKMGLHEHDVILQMNNVLIEGEAELRRMLRDCPPGRTVILVLSRDGQLLTLRTEMADKQEVDRQAWAQHLAGPQAPPASPPAPVDGLPSGQASPSAPPSKYSRGFLSTLLMSPSYTGAQMENMSPQLARFFGVASNSGLLVRSVADSSPAAVAGMHAGDVVLRANSHGILSMADWARVIKEAKGHPVLVVVLRDRAEHTLTLIPDGKRRTSLETTPEPLAQAGRTL